MPSIYRLHKRCSSARRQASWLAIILSALLMLSANADIYRSTDALGNTAYSDQKPSLEAVAESPPVTTNAYSATVQRNNTVKDHRVSVRQAIDTKGSPDSNLIENPVDINWTEAQCQQYYGHSCGRIMHWKKYALAACGSDSRCDDEGYLARKYQPVTLQKLQQVARAAAIRNNRQNDEINQFLRQKYTDYCAHQSVLSCKNKQCQQTVLDACNDPRSLEQLFANYSGLTPIEKHNIIVQAKALSADGGSNSASYQKRLGDLLSLLLSQALLGI